MSIHDEAITAIHGQAETAAAEYAATDARRRQLEADLSAVEIERDTLRMALNGASETIAAKDAEIARLRAELEACQGQVPPPPLARPLIGTNLTGGAPQLRAAIGEDLLPSARSFKAAGASAPPYADVDDHLALGHRVYLSLKDMPDVAPTAQRYEGQDVHLIFHHEPEDDTDPTTWRDEQRAAEDDIAGRLPFVACLMGSTFREEGADVWIPADVNYAEIAADVYLRGYPWNAGGFDWAFEPVIAWARSKGLPLVITEVGALSKLNSTVVPEDVQVAAIEQLHRIVEANRDLITAVCWWESSTTKSGTTRDYRIAGRPRSLAAYRAIAEAFAA